MSEKLRTQKIHTTRYDWLKPHYFTFREFCQALNDSGLFKLFKNDEVTSIQEAYQKWTFGYDLHRKMFQFYGIEPPTNQFCPTPRTYYSEFESWENILVRIETAA